MIRGRIVKELVAPWRGRKLPSKYYQRQLVGGRTRAAKGDLVRPSEGRGSNGGMRTGKGCVISTVVQIKE